MRLSKLLGVFLFIVFASLRAETGAPPPASAPVPTPWDHVRVSPMKTSIYVGSVRLTTGIFERQGSNLSTTYDARVVPWFFWGETGRITITLTDADLAQLAKGQTAEFSGEGTNQKNKPRKISGRAQPADASSGKIKVRVMADGIELIFNGTYQFGDKQG